MHILVLTSSIPSFEHTVRASTRIITGIMQQMRGAGHTVSFATAQFPFQETVKDDIVERLRQSGIRYIGDFSSYLQGTVPQSKLGLAARYFKEAFFSYEQPRFRNPEKIVSLLKASGAEVVLFFWDTWFEYLIPWFRMPMAGYWGKQRQAASLAVIGEEYDDRSFYRKINKYVILKSINSKIRKHLCRARKLDCLSNICNLDAEFYTGKKIPCVYIPNMWPDDFGSSWREQREKAQAGRKRFGILANIGGLGGTGNYFGLSFLADKVLPKLAKRNLNVDWEINICGSGALPEKLAKNLKHPRVNIKGYVADINNEMLSNQLFLLLNNYGPHTGGYTRVIYAFSSGSCLIAHSKLDKSMPEVKHGYNALLGNDKEGVQITDLICEAVKNESVRSEIGRQARHTYEQEYSLEIVTGKILDILETALKKRGSKNGT